jgi:hypothetical protein
LHNAPRRSSENEAIAADPLLYSPCSHLIFLPQLRQVDDSFAFVVSTPRQWNSQV